MFGLSKDFSMRSYLWIIGGLKSILHLPETGGGNHFICEPIMLLVYSPHWFNSLQFMFHFITFWIFNAPFSIVCLWHFEYFPIFTRGVLIRDRVSGVLRSVCLSPRMRISSQSVSSQFHWGTQRTVAVNINIERPLMPNNIVKYY